jgi:hypothetical protein
MSDKINKVQRTTKFSPDVWQKALDMAAVLSDRTGIPCSTTQAIERAVREEYRRMQAEQEK